LINAETKIEFASITNALTNISSAVLDQIILFILFTCS